MNDPKRLLDGDDLGAALLGSARSDEPSRVARQRTAAALGVAIGTAALTTSATAGGALSGAPPALGASGAAAGTAIGAGAGAGAGGAAVKVAGTTLLFKVLVGGLLTAAVAGGVVAVQTRSAAPPPAVSTATATATATANANANANATPTPNPNPISSADGPAANTPPPGAAPPDTAANAAPVPAAATAKPAARGVRAATDPSAGSAESALARELRALDVARAALNRGDPSTCLAELDRHDRAFPSGPLRMEASVTRAEALLARGDKARAQRLAQDLLARDPSGPFARRLRTIAESP